MRQKRINLSFTDREVDIKLETNDSKPTNKRPLKRITN